MEGLALSIEENALDLKAALDEVDASIRTAIGPVEKFVKIILPAALPRLFLALRVGVGIAIIVAVTEIMGHHPDWHSKEAALKSAFEDFNLEDLWREATATAARVKGSSSADILIGILSKKIEAKLGGKVGEIEAGVTARYRGNGSIALIQPTPQPGAGIAPGPSETSDLEKWADIIDRTPSSQPTTDSPLISAVPSAPFS